MAEHEQMNIYQKLARIRKQVDVIRKNKKGYGYTYVSEEEILAKITVFMDKYNLSLIPGIVGGTTKVEPYTYKKTKSTKGGEFYEENVNEVLVSADMTWTWVNNDNPDERVVVGWTLVGQQSDASQAFGSGLTYSDRYFLLKYFNVATTDDDPDAHRSKQRAAEAAEDKMVAGQIISKFDGLVKAFLGANEDKAEDVKKFVSKYKGMSSIKYIGEAVSNELFELAKSKRYTYFMELLSDIGEHTSLDARQLELLIKIDFFKEFGNQRELFRIVEFFNMFKKGQAKQIKKSLIDGTPLEPVVKRYAVGVTRSGGEAKSYTLLDVMSILKGAEEAVKSLHMDDLDDITKVRNFYDVMGYIGYTSGKEEDRKKLYITGVKPLYRKRDDKLFGYSLFTKSIGSGKESRFTVYCKVFDREPVQKGDIIYCKGWERDGIYFRMLDYEKVY